MGVGLRVCELEPDELELERGGTNRVLVKGVSVALSLCMSR